MKGKYKRGAITLLKNPASFRCRKERRKRRAIAYWIRAWHAFINFIVAPAWNSGLLRGVGGGGAGATGNKRHFHHGFSGNADLIYSKVQKRLHLQPPWFQSGHEGKVPRHQRISQFS